MSKKFILLLSLISSFLFLYEANIVRTIITFVFLILLYLYLKDYSPENKDISKDIVLNIILICLMLISKGTYTYNTIIRSLNKSYRLIAGFVFCIPNLYWIYLFSKKINNLIIDVLENRINNKLLKYIFTYIVYRIACLFIISLFPDLKEFNDINNTIFFYISIPVVLYATHRFIKLKNDYVYKILTIFVYIIIITSHINALIQGSYIIVWQSYYTFSAIFTMLLIYPTGEFVVRNKLQDRLFKYVEIFMYAWSIFTFVALIIGILNIKSNIFPNIYFTDKDGYRLCVNSWAEGTAMIQSTFTLICMILVYIDKDKTHRIINVLCSVINYVCLCLANTRMPFYSFLICGGMLIFICYKKSENILRSILFAFLFICVFYFGRDLIFNINAHVQENISSNAELRSVEVDYGPRRIENGGNFLNGRQNLWMASIKHIKNNPESLLIGVSQVSVYTVFEENNVVTDSTSMHNEYVQVLTAYGILGLLAYVVFSLITIINCLKLFFDRKETNDIKIFIPLIALEMMNYMVVNGLTSGVGYDSIILFMCCGMVNGYYELKKDIQAF